MSETAKVTIHMVSSLDGFIAKKDDDVSWMHSTDRYEEGVELTDEYVTDFIQSIDCYVMGSHTYEHAMDLGWPYGDTPVVVVTSRDLSDERESVTFYSGDLKLLVNGQLKTKYTNIWMVGGASLTKNFILLELADKIVISVMPVLLGGGVLFFDYIGVEQRLHLLDIRGYKDGMVEMSYEITKYR